MGKVLAPGFQVAGLFLEEALFYDLLEVFGHVDWGALHWVGCYWWDKGNFILFRKGTRREGGGGDGGRE